MKRIATQPRPDWRTKVESQGLVFLECEGWELWDESAYYELSEFDVSSIEHCTRELVSMCREAVDMLVRENKLHLVGIPEQFHAYVRRSWLEGHPSLYGRFDLAYDGRNPPKLLEFNADTPTALLESAVVQWYWLQDKFPGSDQYNSIHERLLDAWKSAVPTGPVHFACATESPEDVMTIEYLRDTAGQAGLATHALPVGAIGWNAAAGEFRDESERAIRHLFKLYPWEWLMDEEFSRFIPLASTRWIEPAWKLILSSKAILCVLHSLFPRSPYLLPATLEPPKWSHVRKPFFSREGANITVVDHGRVTTETPGPYAGPYVYQAKATLPRFGDRYALVGSWVVGGKDCGVGMREDTVAVLSNVSPFVPHVFNPGESARPTLTLAQSDIPPPLPGA
ncbi:MAG: glutathionylspermidine synthase family protein [Phycisphaerales bacterium]